MKGDAFLRVIVILLVAAVAGYLLISLLPGSDPSYTTYKAVHYEVGGLTTSGFVVRSEQTVSGGAGRVVVRTREEGERVAKGASVASVFRNESARKRQDRIDKLEDELAQLEETYSFANSGMDVTSLDSDILRLMSQVTASSFRGKRDVASGAAANLKVTVLRRYLTADDTQLLWNRITDTRQQLNELYAEAKAEAGSIDAPQAGYFSASVDGYEAVLTPEFLETATVAQFAAARPDSEAAKSAVCKLVTSPKWFYVTELYPAAISGLKVGARIEVSFVYDFNQSVEMQVYRISPSQEGRCLLILSSEDYIQTAVSTRRQSATLMQEEVSGLLVPKTAIYADDDGTSFVYVLEGIKARKKTVRILRDLGEQFLVELNQASTRNLWPDDEIILTKEEMFDGKVMEK